MAQFGRVNNVTIKNNLDSGDIQKFFNIELELTMEGDKSIVIITNSDNQLVRKYLLNDCSYIQESSLENVVCLRIDSRQETLVIIDKDKQAVNLLKDMKRYCERNKSNAGKRKALEEPLTSSQEVTHDSKELPEKLDQFITALNNGEKDAAARYAGQLTSLSQRPCVRFQLEKIGESGNKATTDKLLKLQVTIASAFDKIKGNPYEVMIRSRTTIGELKRKISDQTQIAAECQNWFLNRQPLLDTYEFKDTPQLENNKNAMLFLYITKA